MPNYCDYTLKVKGNKDNCKKFYDLMTDYDIPNHLFRMFEADIDEEGDNYLIVSGYCAWSIESCCRAGGYSNGVDLFAVNTKDLNLELEVWSRECEGCFFEEHYIYNNGKCLAEECEDIIPPLPYWDKAEFPTLEEYCVEWGLNEDEVSADMFDEDGEYIANEDSGFGSDWGSWNI